jgi:ADP-ribose pyrophosphatase YjhB (NUDIX family)
VNFARLFTRVEESWMPDTKRWDVGVSAVVVRDKRVLLVRYAYGNRLGQWTLPGGYAHHDETLDQAAIRELQEEAGLRGEPCGIVSVRTRIAEEGGAVFVAFRVWCDEGEPAPDNHEVDAAWFFGREELLSLNPVMELSRQIALAVLAAPGVELIETDIPGRTSPSYKAYLVNQKKRTAIPTSVS